MVLVTIVNTPGAVILVLIRKILPRPEVVIINIGLVGLPEAVATLIRIVHQCGNGMANLTKEQQKFWDLLRLPYKKGCYNCEHKRVLFGDVVTLSSLCCEKISPGPCWVGNNFVMWEWDGEIN